eukprot:15459597-Alexandrium_andersonii.AAC.1
MLRESDALCDSASGCARASRANACQRRMALGICVYIYIYTRRRGADGIIFDGHVMVDPQATLFELGIGPGSTIEIFGMAG